MSLLYDSESVLQESVRFEINLTLSFVRAQNKQWKTLDIGKMKRTRIQLDVRGNFSPSRKKPSFCQFRIG